MFHVQHISANECGYGVAWREFGTLHWHGSPVVVRISSETRETKCASGSLERSIWMDWLPAQTF